MYVWVLFPLSIYVYVCMCRYYTTICCLLKRQMFCLDCTLFNSFVLHFREFIFCVDANNANVHSQTTDLDKDGVCTFFFKYALKCNNTKKNCRTKKSTFIRANNIRIFCDCRQFLPVDHQFQIKYV